MTSPRNPKYRRYAIVGFPRSGTTLLSRLLDTHADISCPPETHLLTAAARFLSEQRNVEGPPIGVLSGLTFLGIETDEVMTPLREMVFGFHERIAAGAACWVEKTGVDVFHLETLESLLSGHVRFIVIHRNPLDVIASNIELANVMGAPLTDLWQAIRDENCPYEGIAKSWADRTRALNDFTRRQADDCFSLTYEELTSDPHSTLSGLLEFMDMGRDSAEQVLREVFQHQARIGLGDFRINEMSEIRPPAKDAWRKRLPRTSVSRVLPHLIAEMESLGYAPPKAPAVPEREVAVRQFAMAAQMKRRMLEPQETN